MSKTLHLNLKRKWFDMILSGEKEQEYREIKPFFISRLFEYKNWLNITGLDAIKHFETSFRALGSSSSLWRFIKPFDSITFSNGMTKDCDRFEIELKGINISTGRKSWGAEEKVFYFVFDLGKILSKRLK